MCYCDGEEPIFHIIETRRARKPHQCYECSRMIQPGERYEHAAGKWHDFEGIDVFKTCAHCLELRSWINERTECFCWTYGDLASQAIEEARELSIEEPGVLFGAYRRLVKIRRAHAEAQRLEVAA